MASKKQMKIGIIFAAAVAIVLSVGITVGIKEKKARAATSVNAKSIDGLDGGIDTTKYDIDCVAPPQTRHLAVPGVVVVEQYQGMLPPPAKRRSLVRALGTEAVITGSSEAGIRPSGSSSDGSVQAGTAASSKAAKDGLSLSMGLVAEVVSDKSTKGSKSKKCMKPSLDEMCPSRSKSAKARIDKMIGTRKLGKDADFSMIQGSNVVTHRGTVGSESGDSGAAVGSSTQVTLGTKDSKSGKGKKSKSKTPTTCYSAESIDSIATPTPQATTERPSDSRPIVPAAAFTSFPTPTCNTPTVVVPITTRPPTSKPPITDSLSPTTYEPTQPLPLLIQTLSPTTLSPVTPSPTTESPVTPVPTLLPTTLSPTDEPSSDPTTKPTNMPTDSPTVAASVGATPTVATEFSSPPTKPGRDG